MTTKQDYKNFKFNTFWPWCWACGRDESQRPDRWFAEWFLDRAHIVNKPRIEDVRAVVLLCRLCHSRATGARIAGCEGRDWPPLTVAHLLWLKVRFDPSNYSREFLQRYTVQRLPRAARPPLVYRNAYHSRRGAVLVG